MAPALDVFRSQKIESFPAAVHWLLSSYAPEKSLETALRSVLAASQSPSQTVRMFGIRLQLEAGRLGALVSIRELKSLFAQGLNESTHSSIASYQPPEEMEPHFPLSVLIQREKQLETGMSSRTTTRASTTLPSRTITKGSKAKDIVLAEIEGNPSDATEEAGEFDHELELMAISGDRHRNCYVCYRPTHGWMSCPLLAHVSDKEKEDIAIRRRQFFDQNNSTRASRPQILQRDRQGFQDYQGSSRSSPRPDGKPLYHGGQQSTPQKTSGNELAPSRK